MKKLIWIACLFCTMTLSVQAQNKVGYVDAATILQELPEVKQLQANLQSYQTQLEKKYEQLIQTYQQQEQDALAKKQNGTLSPADEKVLLEKLQAEQQNIIKFEQESQQKLLAKEQELFKPLEDRIMAKINEVAKENGFSYIIRSGQGSPILYADPKNDITPLVKAKL